jgi:hypothetical protein
MQGKIQSGPRKCSDAVEDYESSKKKKKPTKAKTKTKTNMLMQYSNYETEIIKA